MDCAMIGWVTVLLSFFIGFLSIPPTRSFYGELPPVANASPVFSLQNTGSIPNESEWVRAPIFWSAKITLALVILKRDDGKSFLRRRFRQSPRTRANHDVRTPFHE